MEVPKTHIAVVGGSHYHCRVERDVECCDGLRMRQKLLYYFVLSDVPHIKVVVGAGRQKHVFVLVDHAFRDETLVTADERSAKLAFFDVE